MIAIVDYGVGNLFSLKSSFAAIGADAVVTGEAEVLRRADRILLPGVGAFGDAADKLRASGLFEPVKALARAGVPLLGICLGMQLLLEKGYEYGEHEGLGLIKGSVKPIAPLLDPPTLKVPQMGWNALHFPERRERSPLFRYTPEGAYVYFVHSYSAQDCSESVLATTDYGAELTAAVGRDNVLGCQFHPEKSGETGLNILRAFCEL